MSEQRAGILSIGAYVPERVVTNDDMSKFVDTSDEWIFQRTGIHERRFARDDDATRSERRARVQIVAVFVDESHGPTQASVGLDHEESPLAGAHVDAVLAVDGR